THKVKELFVKGESKGVVIDVYIP
ncbi:MAG: hypothetical protein HW396_624, partial [Candidatus Dadabacteria bacterium]|nr:hypothetical protein [Candidatus Dadabacteria bacterium]